MSKIFFPRLAGGAVLIALFLGGCGGPAGDGEGVLARYPVTKGDLRITVTESGSMRSAKPAFISVKTSGKITFLAPEGEPVVKGAVLMRLENKQFLDELENAKRDLDSANRGLENANAEVKLFELESAKKLEDAEQNRLFAVMLRDQYRDGKAPLLEQDSKLAVERAEAERDIAKEKAERMPAMLEKGFVNAAELRTARLDAKEKEQALAKKEREYQVFLKYDKPQDMAKKEAEVKNTEIAMERVRQQLTAQRGKLEVEKARQVREIERLNRKVKEATEEAIGLELKAPSDGILVYFKRAYWDDTRLEIGTEVRKEQRVMELPDLTDMVAEVGINEIVVAKVAVGQTATVTLEGMGGKVFQGKISKLATTADKENPWGGDGNRFKATVTLTDSAGTSFRPGLSARAEILVAELKSVVSVPINTVTHRNDKHWCWVDTGGRLEKRVVELGQASNDRVEIRSGLKEGETVVVQASEPTDGAHP